MNLKRTALSGILALMMALQPAAAVFADDGETVTADTSVSAEVSTGTVEEHTDNAEEETGTAEEQTDNAEEETGTAEEQTDDAAEDIVSLTVPDETPEETFIPEAEPPAEGEERLAEIEKGQAEEQEFLENNPEIAEMGEHIAEGDTLPCSENDPSFHKYVKMLMDSTGGEGYVASLTSMGARLLTWTVSGADDLIHQDRFADKAKTYGVDVSYFQGDIDWKKVKAEGISFCILRAGYRGYGEAGNIVLDERFTEYLKDAKDAGMEVGVYFYTQAINPTEAREEADFVYKYIKKYKLELPVYFDMETVENAVGRLDKRNLSVAKKTEIVEAFCDRVIYHGYTAGVYSNPQWLTYYLNAERLQSKYPLWLANYTTCTKYEGNFNIWQYGAGPVNGVSSAFVDMNVRYESSGNPSPVKNLRLDSEISDSVKLTWDASKNCLGYEILRKTSSGTETVKRTSSTSATVKLTEASAEYSVRAYGQIKSNYVYGTVSNKLKLGIDLAGALTASSRTDTSLKLKWTGVKNAVRYDVSMYDEKDGEFKTIASTASPSLTVNGLTAATVYKFRLRAVKQNGSTLEKCKYCPAVYFGTRGKKITGLKYISKDNNSITISWSATKDKLHTTYQVVDYDASTGKYTALGSTSSTKLTVTKLTQGRIYNLCVRSNYNSENEGVSVYGTPSEPYQCATKCAAPANIRYTSTDNSYTVKWDVPADKAGYYVYAAAYGQTPVKVADIPGTSFTLKGLGKGLYSIYVKPYIKCSTARYFGNESKHIVAVVGKESPAILTATGDAFTAKVTWKKVSGASGYKAFLYDDAQSKYVLKASLGASDLSYTFKGLSPATTVKMKIYTLYPGGTTVGSSEISVSTKSFTYTAPNPSVKSKTADSVTVKWGGISKAEKYRAYIYNETSKKYVSKATLKSSARSYTFKALDESKSYSFKIAAIYPDGKSKSSNEVKSTTTSNKADPGAPEYVKGVSSTATTVKVKWPAAKDAVKYNAYMLNTSTGAYVKKGSTTSLNYTFTGLTTGKLYKIRISAVTSGGAEKKTATYTVSPKPAAPKLSLSSKTETTAVLKWDAVPQCTKYYIYKLDVLENKFVQLGTTSKTTYTVSGLKKGSRNIFKIQAAVVTDTAYYKSVLSSQLSVLTKGIEYYPTCPSSCKTLYQAFDALGLPKEFSLQEKMAIANAIAGYEGTAEQNTAMLNTLKSGKLIKPQW
ncbi:MAG: fibronectin type III domain-containing protein [Ruminococcus sp.]|nr:fibronectin type III domain-containing protein [Ruminococcus sp.]